MLRRSFLIALCLPLAASAQDDAQRILGRWYTVERSRGGIGATIEFLPAGIVKYSSAAVVELTYSFKGQTLVLKFTDPEKGPQPDQVLTVESLVREKMTARSQDAPDVQQWARMGIPESNDNLILGNWTSSRNMDGRTLLSSWRFRQDGSAVFTVPFVTKTGRYQMNKNSIRLDVEGAIAVEGPLSWEGEILVLPGNKTPTKLRRF
jgi:hypothetical protein